MRRRTDSGRSCDNAKAKRPSETPIVLAATLKSLADGAKAGDAAALAKLRRMLDQHPEIWQTCGDLTKHAERAWIELLSADPLGAESIKRHIEKLEADLAGPHPTPVERVLVHQVVLCYLAVRHAEIAATTPGKSSLNQAMFRTRRSEVAQRRLVSALKMLAQLRATVPAGLAPINSLQVFSGERKRA